MIISKQDQNIILQDSLRQKPDTVKKSLVSERLANIEKKKVDTISDGIKPAITFYDPGNSLLTTNPEYLNSFPFTFLETNTEPGFKKSELILKDLREGEKPASQPLKEDWLIFIVLIVSVLYIFISIVYNRLFSDMKKFFLFRGIGDPASHDLQVLFNWKSTIMNLVSFLNIALLIYCAADFYEFIPEIIPGILFWLICVVGTIAIITIRHIICTVTGNISGETDLFNEYIITIYHSYRYLAIVFFILIIFMLYTNFISVKSLLFVGLFSFIITYLIRIFRLFFIFLKKNISIFYLILYLCALEFLPVLVIMKYITGLF